MVRCASWGWCSSSLRAAHPRGDVHGVAGSTATCEHTLHTKPPRFEPRLEGRVRIKLDQDVISDAFEVHDRAAGFANGRGFALGIAGEGRIGYRRGSWREGGRGSEEGQQQVQRAASARTKNQRGGSARGEERQRQRQRAGHDARMSS